MSRQPTIEWQVCGVCNYDCSYCIQKKTSRVGHPALADVEGFVAFFAALPGRWEIKMSGGEPFAWKGFMDAVVPGLVARTTHTLSVLTNLSAPLAILERFAALTRGRLGIVSASLHLEHTDAESFVAKAVAFRRALDPAARFVVNEVLVPDGLGAARAARAVVTGAGLRWFPQIMKVGKGVASYEEDLGDLVAADATPREANRAPSYRGRLCWSGAEYFVVTQTGDAWACRTAKRHDEGYLGNIHRGDVTLATGPSPCSYDICPCTVPANRGMIEGVAP